MRRDQKGVAAVAQPRPPSAHRSMSWFRHQERKPRPKLILDPADTRLAKSKTQVHPDDASDLEKALSGIVCLTSSFGYDFLLSYS
jgi:hypothetical protein